MPVGNGRIRKHAFSGVAGGKFTGKQLPRFSPAPF
jgi:hypothetical protein